MPPINEKDPGYEKNITEIVNGIISLPVITQDNRYIEEEFFDKMEKLYGSDSVEEAKRRHGDMSLVATDEELLIPEVVEPLPVIVDIPVQPDPEPTPEIRTHFSEVNGEELVPDGNSGWIMRKFLNGGK